jgi:hypothetical protein
MKMRTAKKTMEKPEMEIGRIREEIKELGPVMRGSVVELKNKCGNKNCACARGMKHRQIYFSVNLGGRTKMMFLGKKRKPEADVYSGNYRRMMELVDEMTLANMRLLKEKYARGNEKQAAKRRGDLRK